MPNWYAGAVLSTALFSYINSKEMGKAGKYMKVKKVLGIILISSMFVFLVAGCSLVDNLKTFKENDDTADTKEQNQVIVEDDLNSNKDQDEDTMTAPMPNKDDDSNSTDNNKEQNAADTDASAEAKDTAPDDDNSGEETKNVVLYFANEDGSLEEEQRTIPKQEGVARATINQLISGPNDESLLPTLPSSTILEDIDISNGVCTVDFSSDLMTDMSDDQKKQKLALYSIVNTLTQFDTVDSVRILVNGQALETFAGVDASTTIAPLYW